MSISYKDINNCICNGLKESWFKNFQMTGERRDSIKPEYLMTMAICFSFAGYIFPHLHEVLIVRSEHQTKKIWQKLGSKYWRLRIRRLLELTTNSTRNGNVDICLLFKYQGVEQPIGIIENKGYLQFTNSNLLYQNSENELRKDLKRNIKFLAEVAPGCRGVEYTAFTFLLNDTQSALKSEGLAYCNDKKIYFEEYVDRLIQGLGFERKVIVGTVDSELYGSVQELNEPGEDGRPASLDSPPWQIAYGVIVIHNLKNLKNTHIQFN